MLICSSICYLISYTLTLTSSSTPAVEGCLTEGVWLVPPTAPAVEGCPSVGVLLVPPAVESCAEIYV